MAYSKELENLLNQGYRYAISLTNNSNDAFDLVQSSYLKLLEKGQPLVISYFIRTIRNLFIDTKRREKLRFNWVNSLKKDPSYEPDFTVEPFLEKILNELPNKNREIIFLSIVQGYTAQEISDLMEIPRGTILSILHRTKLKLKEKLEENQV